MQHNKVKTVETFLAESAKAVAELLDQYSTYLELDRILKTGVDHRKRTPKKFSFLGGPVQYMGDAVKLTPELREAVELEIKTLSDAMKFQNPLIWLQYKNLAYKHEGTKALKTLRDLLSHCEVDGICHKRFDAINLYLRRKYNGKDMRSPSLFSPDMDLEAVGQDERFLGMCLDEEFMEIWKKHENGKTGKWRDYVLSTPDHDCEVNCTC